MRFKLSYWPRIWPPRLGQQPDGRWVVAISWREGYYLIGRDRECCRIPGHHSSEQVWFTPDPANTDAEKSTSP